jgi:hypothetical protein
VNRTFAVMTLAAVLILTACSAKPGADLVGAWKYNGPLTPNIVFWSIPFGVVTFAADGTGTTTSLPSNEQEPMGSAIIHHPAKTTQMTWTVTTDGKLNIVSSTGTTYDYTVKGNVLQLTAFGGAVTAFNRMK